jgi:hypothetical protein
MARNTVTYVVSGECCFLAMMGCCFALEPSWVAVRQGLSYYGNYVPTGIPFVIGFGSSIALTGLGLARIRPRGATAQRFRIAVLAVLALMAWVPLTPYKLDLVFDWLHIGVATVLFCSGLAFGGWLVLRLDDRPTRCLYAIESGAGVAILTAELGIHDYMIPSELAFQLAAFGLIVHGTRRLVPPSSRAAQAQSNG